MAKAPKRIILSLPDWDDEDFDEDAPCEFRIFSFGDTKTTKGKYSFDAESANAVMKAAADYGNRLTIDYEHQALSDPPVQAPAAASFLLELRADGLYAVDVKWTPKAAEMLRNKEYLYFSPAFIPDKSGRPQRLLNVALTNLPATKGMQSLVAANQIQESRMLTVLTALSLKEDASEAEALVAVSKMSEERKQIVALTGKESLLEALSVVTAWKQSAAECVALREKISAQEVAAVDAEFMSIVESATKSGVIPPSEDHERRKFAMGLRGKPECVSALSSYVKALGPSVVTAPVKVATSEPATGTDGIVVLTDCEMKIAHKMNVPLEALRANKIRRIQLSKLPAVTETDELEGE